MRGAVDPRRESAERRAEGATSPESLRPTDRQGEATLEGQPTAGDDNEPTARRPLMPDARPSLAALEHHDEFVHRHLGLTDADREAMLAVVGAASTDDLLRRAVPAAIADRDLPLPPPAGETEVLARLRDLAARNELTTSMIGMGYYPTVTPPVILRNVLENPAWYTAYTPYQPEISQ